MKIVLVKDGNRYKPERGALPLTSPDQIVLEVEDGIAAPVAEIWSPMFPPGIGKAMEEFLKQEGIEQPKELGRKRRPRRVHR